MPKRVKSIAIAMSVIAKVMNVRIEARRDKMTPPGIEMRNAMNARPQAIGWRIMAPVRPLAESAAAREKPVPSIVAMMSDGL